MTDLVIKVLDSGKEKFRHTAQETADFTMLKVTGVAAAANEVLKQEQLGTAVTAVPEVSSVDFTGATPAGLDGKYFRIDSVSVPYYVWFNLDSGSTNPSAANTGRTGIEVGIATGDSAGDMAGKAQVVLEAHSAFTASVLTNVVTITNSVAGSVANVAAGDSGLSVNTDTQGIDARVGGIATLNVNGKLTAAQVPAIAITDTFVVNSQANMLLLSTAETGDVAVRTDVNKTFILAGSNPATLGDWQEMLTPTDAVTSVNGQTAVVVLDTDDISDTTATNKYFTETRVRSTVLTGLNTTAGNAAATDTVLEAIGKLEGASVLNTAKVSYSASTARSDLIETASITDGETNKAPCSNLVFDALAGKASTSHDHSGVYSPVGHDHSGVYAPVSHGHAISDVTNLQTELNGKVAVADSTITVTNDNASAITEGKAVYLKSDGHVDLARANAIATCGDVVGFVKTASIAASGTGLVIVKPGEIVTGLSGLTIGAWYFVSVATAGSISLASGNTYGVNSVVKPIGIAVAADKLMYLPGESVEVAS